MLNDYKNITHNICQRRGWLQPSENINTVWLLFTEEVGELASAIRQYKEIFKKQNLRKSSGQDVMSEMGDVFSYLFQLADMLNVDLDEMWREHQQKVENKKY